MSEWIRVEKAIRIVEMIGICSISLETAQAVIIETFRRMARSEKPITNGDRIRSMSDEELAELLTPEINGAAPHKLFAVLHSGKTYLSQKVAKEKTLDWLQQPTGVDA